MVDQQHITSALTTDFSVDGDFSINAITGVVDVTGDVRLTSRMSTLSVQFGTVTGNFECSHMGLRSLKGAPKETGGYFRCRDNLLSSLDHSPSKTGGRFDCGFNMLKSLEGSPQQVGHSFVCDSNHLENLKGVAIKIGKELWCVENPLTSLEGLHTVLQSVSLTYSSDLPLLGLLSVPKFSLLSKKDANDEEFDRAFDIAKILNKHEGTGRRGAFPAARELILAGELLQKKQGLAHNPFEANARL